MVRYLNLGLNQMDDMPGTPEPLAKLTELKYAIN